MEHKIIVEYNEKYNFNKVTCEQGHYMTTWVEGDDIKTFTASTILPEATVNIPPFSVKYSNALIFFSDMVCSLVMRVPSISETIKYPSNFFLI